MSDKDTADEPDQTRRTILKASGAAALAGIIAPGTAGAQTDLPVEIAQNAEEEYVVVRNVGDEEIDLTDYHINFEAGEESNVDQIRQLAGEVTVAPGAEIIVPVGVNEISGDNVVELEDPYETEMLNNQDPDVVALLDPDENVVVASDATVDGDTGDDADDGDDSDDGDDTDDDGDDDTDDADDTGDDGDGEDEEEEEQQPDEDDGDDDEEETDTDAKDDEKTDADDDGVPASEDADDDCPTKH